VEHPLTALFASPTVIAMAADIDEQLTDQGSRRLSLAFRRRRSAWPIGS